jgi:MinD-like ATPase involved in chromosome partitioning or flagellar assembly
MLHPGVMDVMVGSEKVRALDTPNPTARDVWKLEEALYRVEQDYDLVIIDTPPSLNALTRTAWVASDRVLVVSEPAMFSVVAAYRAVSAIKEMQEKLNPRVSTAGIVVNRYLEGNPEHEFRLGELKEVFANGLMQPYFNDIPQVQQAQGAGRPIHLWPGEVAKGIADGFDHILNQVVASFTLKPDNNLNSNAAAESRFNRFKKVMRGSGLESVIQLESPIDQMAANQAAIDKIIEIQQSEEAIVIDTPQYVYVPGGKKRY